MARGILHDIAVQHESDSRLSFGVSSPDGRVGAGREESQQFRGGPILRTQCVQSKAGAFSGSQSRQGKSQEPCSLSRRQEGNRVSEAD
jgi:hypothetical protein